MSEPSKRPFAKRSLGQNFLIDDVVISQIISSLRIDKGDLVVEIGPGRGALTSELLRCGADLTAIELDRDLAPKLRGEFKDHDNFRCVEADVLEIDLAELIRDPPVKLVGNLPYYISTAIIQKLIEKRHLFSQIVLMLQREVVERIAAKPGESSRGFLTVLVEEAFTIERLFDVPPNAFMPRPKVWSSVVSLVPKRSKISDAGVFRKVASLAFAQKRKTILNNLKSHYPDIVTVLNASGIEPIRRAETVTNSEWAVLVSNIVNKNGPPN